MPLEERMNSKEIFKHTAAEILKSSRLLPTPTLVRARSDTTNPFDVLGPLESASLSCETLNVYSLCKLAGVEIHWTTNLCRHMLLSKFAGKHTLELYALPSMFSSNVPDRLDLGKSLIQEIRDSYASLFNPYTERHGGILSRAIRRRSWCWCQYCVCRRIRVSELEKLKKSPGFSIIVNPSGSFYDRDLEELTTAEANHWDAHMYPHLWQRIDELGNHLQRSKPWTIWVVLRDTRDSVQYWTFLLVN